VSLLDSRAGGIAEAANLPRSCNWQLQPAKKVDLHPPQHFHWLHVQILQAKVRRQRLETKQLQR
jgi:hypothetical protein